MKSGAGARARWASGGAAETGGREGCVSGEERPPALPVTGGGVGVAHKDPSVCRLSGAGLGAALGSGARREPCGCLHARRRRHSRDVCRRPTAKGF